MQSIKNNSLSLSLYERVLWILFLIWSMVGIIQIAFHVQPKSFAFFGISDDIIQILKSIWPWGDFIFMLLAFVNIFLATVRSIGWKDTFFCAFQILSISFLIEAYGTLTGFPFGPYIYTQNFGPLIANLVPVAIPLAWFTIINGCILIFKKFQSSVPIWLLALATGISAFCIDWLMEPFAWRVRGYWIWQCNSIPLQNYAAWFVIAALLASLNPLARTSLLNPPDKRALFIISTICIVFIIGRMSLL